MTPCPECLRRLAGPASECITLHTACAQAIAEPIEARAALFRVRTFAREMMSRPDLEVYGAALIVLLEGE